MKKEQPTGVSQSTVNCGRTMKPEIEVNIREKEKEHATAAPETNTNPPTHYTRVDMRATPIQQELPKKNKTNNSKEIWGAGDRWNRGRQSLDSGGGGSGGCVRGKIVCLEPNPEEETVPPQPIRTSQGSSLFESTPHLLPMRSVRFFFSNMGWG